MEVLLLDNIDSFTFNIYHYLEQLPVRLTVKDNTEVLLSEVTAFDAIVLSPGPGLPKEAGKLMEVLAIAIEHCIPVLGICLGMQAIAEHFGGTLYNQAEVKHGQEALVAHHSDSTLFRGIPSPLTVGLYHSWAVSEPLPQGLIATASTEEGVLMALEHGTLPVYGVQFHPESILSEHGLEVFANFVKAVGSLHR